MLIKIQSNSKANLFLPVSQLPLICDSSGMTGKSSGILIWEDFLYLLAPPSYVLLPKIILSPRKSDMTDGNTKKRLNSINSTR